MASTWLPSLQQGLAAARPTNPDVARNCLAFYYATDTGVLSVYQGGTWNADEDVSGGTWVSVPTLYTSVDATAATLSVANVGNQVIFMDKSGGITFSLPAATGSGNVIDFIVKTVSTTGYVIQVNGTDSMQGFIVSDKAGTPINYQATSDTDTITLNGTTTGGVDVGDRISLRDIAAGLWQVIGFVEASGTQATPFSDAS